MPTARFRKCFINEQGYKKRSQAKLLDGMLLQITSEILTLNLMTNQVERCEEEGKTVEYEVGGGEELQNLLLFEIR